MGENRRCFHPPPAASRGLGKPLAAEKCAALIKAVESACRIRSEGQRKILRLFAFERDAAPVFWSLCITGGQHMTGATENKAWAVVTGASAGIGAEFCRQLAGRGYSLLLVARRQGRLEQLADELQRRHAVDCRVLPLDMAQESAARTIETHLAEAGIEVEFLVNNAGYAVPGSFTESAWQVHADSLGVMLNSVLELTWRLLPGMQARRRGFVVNVASVAGLVPSSARHTLYGATKAFLINFSEALAMENIDSGVAVSALCPGFTYSEFHDVLGTRDKVSQMPSWMWMEADEVVRYGIESVLRNPPRIVAVPGRVNRCIVMLARKLPLKLSLSMAQRQSHRFRGQD